MFYQRSLLFEAGGLRGAVSPPAGPGQTSPPEDLEILRYLDEAKKPPCLPVY